MYLTQETTNHLTPAMAENDAAMEAFRKAFPYVLGCYIHPSGDKMTYRLGYKETTWVRNRETEAKEIIERLNLPLEAELECWKRNGHVFEINLSIEFIKK